jgi:hypothetical protein
VNRYDLERKWFVKAYGEPAILKTADLIADDGWFSWRHCYLRLRELKKPARESAMKLLRVAQKQRWYAPDPERRDFNKFLKAKADPMQSFLSPVAPGVYQHRCQPILSNGKRVGLTLFGERIRGNKVQIFYQSDETRPMRLERIEIVVKPSRVDYLASLGMKDHRTNYHVKIL